ncbi:MAG: ABC-F family ATP-binding cassette domain-containing protein [Actinomycetes bacterium]
MAHLLNVENVTVTVAARTILDGVSLGLDDGARVGVVGRNGDGKSTLLRVLAGRQQPDAGRVTHAGGLRVGFLDQHDDPVAGRVGAGGDRAAAGTIRRAVVGDAPEHVWASDPAVRAVLAGLLGDVAAVVPGGFDARVSELSGGQRRRVALAAVLVGDHDLVVLDEPTNHLDVEGVAWLARHLRTRWPSSKGGLVVVTHDRWFLDAVCENIWEVHDGVVDSYEGGYAAYVLARAERARVEAATAERRANLLRKELAWLRRGAPARTSKPRFRLDAAAALIADEPAPRNDVELQRMASARLGKDVVDLEDVSYSVRTEDGEERVLLDDVTWRLGPGDRFGLVGVNGSGKTTLLRLVAGDVRPDRGRVRRGSTVRVAMLAQELHELDAVADLRVLQVVERERRSVVVGDREVSAAQLVERLGFTRERAWTPVGELSGGERRRLQLVRLLVHEPNLLLLDEPTNDLDTDTLAAVEDLLDGFAGTLLVASHDRYLLERVCDRQVALLGDGKVRDLPGGVDEYLRLREAVEEDRRAASSRAARPSDDAAAAGSSSTPDAGAVRAARKEMARLERQLSRLAEREARLHDQLTEQATDHERVLALDAELRAVHAEREQVEEAWLAAAEIAG